jgi:choline dehydrogenase
MHVETCAAKNPLYRAFLNAGKQMGLEHVDDHNGYKQEGVHITQRNVGKGIRFNTHYAYVRNQPSRPNLHVQTGARVQRIETSNNRAVRVAVKTPTGDIVYEVERETILCAGAINSPQLLQLSGIGDADRAVWPGASCHHCQREITTTSLTIRPSDTS